MMNSSKVNTQLGHECDTVNVSVMHMMLALTSAICLMHRHVAVCIALLSDTDVYKRKVIF